MKAEVHAIYYHGDGLPLRRAQLIAIRTDPEAKNEYLKLVSEVGFHTRRYTTNGDVTPIQHATSKDMFDTLEFGFGRANVITHWSTQDGKTSMPIQDIEIDEDTPGMLLDVHKKTDGSGQSERYVLAEFTYHMQEDGDNENEQTPEPLPMPGKALSLVA